MGARDWLTGGYDTRGPAADAGLLILRVVPMLLLITLHGLGKVPPQEGFVGWIGSMGFPAPMVFAWLAAFAEVGAAALVLIGLLTRPAALFLVLHFLVVVLVAHAGDAMGDREVAILFGTVALTLMLTGPGRFSVDAVMGGGRRTTAGTTGGPGVGRAGPDRV
jgi:putative oxidoreductase